MEFQTRSEENGIRIFSDFQEALKAAREDTTIWKISFTLPTVKAERIRLLRKFKPTNKVGIFEDTWEYSPMRLE